MDQYIGFYPPGDFWVESSVDLWSYSEKLRDMLELGNFGARSGGLGKQFEAEMSEEVIDYSEDQYRLKFCRDGLILFQHGRLDWQTALQADSETHVRVWATCYDLCNCINLVFHSKLCTHQFPTPGPDSSAYDFKEISNRDVGLFSWHNGRPLKGFVLSKTLVPRLRKREVVSGFDEYCLSAMNHLRRAPILPRSFFDSMNDDLRKVLVENSAVSIMSNLAKSLGQLKIGNYSISLVLSWFVIESHLNRLLMDLLQDKRQRFESAHGGVTSQRCDDLIERLDGLTAFRKCNLVELSDKLTFDIAGRIDSIRKARNKAVHEGHQVTQKESSEAMDMVTEILKEKTGIELSLDRCIYYST